MEIRKPIITFAGSETQLPLQLKESIERELPQEALEWQRPYRRQPKTVYLEAKFEHYTDNFNSTNQLLEKQLLHTYWIECYDVDSYKQHYKENLINWVNKFSKLNSSEWLIVLVDHTDKKLGKTKLLPRSSVADKIKADFPFTGKSATLDRHIVTLTDAFKKDTRAIDSFLQFLNKVRLLLLSAYSKQLTSYEDYIRSQREKRNNDSWDFLTFFLAQEELAFAFELLGLYDEALVQYDELDALFSQFIQNATIDSLPFWLKNLIDKCDSWHGLFLSNPVSFQLREKLKETKGSFLELRNYLFARQCELLLLQHMPWQVANRSLPFLQNCVSELKLLEIQLMPGAVDCWVFLSASEILLICERYNDSSQMDSYSKNTIGVRAYSRRKLEELGKICGLVPGMQSKSDHLHFVVSLIAGMGEDHHTDTSSPSAQTRLKDALSGPDAFLRNYLEFSELTMGTYKHIGRMREARLIGRELAEIYMKLEKYQLALSFLLDLEKVFVAEQWLVLLSNTRKEILHCYEALNDSGKQIVYCFYLASSLDLPTGERELYFEKLQALIGDSKATDEPIKIRMGSVFDVQSLRMSSQNKDFITNFDINLSVQLNSHLVRSLECRRLFFNLAFSPDSGGNPERRRELLNELKNNELCTELKREGLLERPTFDAYLDASSVGIVCKNLQKVLKRFDSQFAGKDALINESELKFFSTSAASIAPGPNDLDLNFNTQHRGTYSLDLLCLFVEPNIYFYNNEIRQYSFDVISQQPSLELRIVNEHLDCLTDELIAGIPQQVRVTIHSGSNYFPKSTRFTFRSSTGLFIRLIDSSNGLDDLKRLRIDSNELLNCELPFELRPFEQHVFRLAVLCEFAEQRSSHLITKKLELIMNDAELKLNCPLLHFSAPFYSTMTLHTCGMTKFVQISLTSNSLLKFNLDSPKLECMLSDDCSEEPQSAVSLPSDGRSPDAASVPSDGPLPNNQTNGIQQLECKYLSNNMRNCSIQNEKILHLMWEVLLNKGDSGDFKLRFNLNYDLDLINYRRAVGGDRVAGEISNGLNGVESDPADETSVGHQYRCDFLLKEFTTLYTVRTSVSPQTNSEFIKAGNLCLLSVKIKRNLGVEPEKNALMYELVSDKTVWAVNGKTAGVLENVEDEEYDLTFEVLPLISGFIPLPGIRLSKYIKQDQQTADTKVPSNLQNASVKLVAFNSGQVYNYSRGLQVNVLQSSGIILND